MIYFTLVALVALFILPILVSIAESQRQKVTSDDEGFWTLSRALMGGCHIKLDPDPMPIVWFDVGLSQGRLHISQRAGDQGWWFEGRIYLSSPVGFAARLHTPSTSPLQPALPGFTVVNDADKESELALSGFSIETSARPRLMQCLEEDDLRLLIKSLKSSLKVNTCEILFANRVFVVRGRIRDGDSASDIAERVGPHLANWLRQLVVPLTQASDRLNNRNEHFQCPVSATDLRYGYENGEVWRCSKCGSEMYRAAMELMKGCVTPSCSGAIDGISEDVLELGRMHIEIKEVDQAEIGELGWVGKSNLHQVQ